jgi:hypothetical protein
MGGDTNGSRTHEPSLRELTGQLDDLKDLMREKFEGVDKIAYERDRLYKERHEAADKAITAALTAQKETTSAAFAASKEAIVKAENSQNSYNTSHNDLIKKQEQMIPRPEVDRIVQAWEEKFNDLKKEVAALKEFRSGGIGEKEALASNRLQHNWSVGIQVVVAIFVSGIVVGIIEILLRVKQ